jgi:hypothetical protein
MGRVSVARVRRVGLVVAAVGAGLVVVLCAHLAWSIAAARDDASRGGRALRAGQFASAATAYHGAVGHLRSGDRSLGILTAGLGWIPVAAPNLRLARLEVAAGRAAVSAAGDLSAVAAGSRAGAGTLDMRPLLAREAPLSTTAAALGTSLGKLRAALPGSRVYESLVRARRSLLTAALPVLRSARAAQALAGFAAPGRIYLLIVQNPAELRATGGLIGAWGLLTTDGTLRLRRLSRDTALPRPRHAVSAPADYLARYGRFYANGAWVNANMSPDFPTSARVLLGLYRSATTRQLDGVVAIDAVTLETLVAALGPLSVDGRRLERGTFLRTVLVDAYRSPGGKRSDLLLGAARAGWRRLPQAGPVAVATALAHAAAGGHVRLFAVNPKVQASFVASGLAGRVLHPTGDYLLLVEQNAGGSKLDFYLHTRLVDRVAIDRSGSARSRLAIELANAAPRRGLSAYAAGLTTPGETPGTNHTFVSIYAARATTMLRFAAGRERTAESSYELGHSVLSWFQSTPPRRLRGATLTLRSPRVARRHGTLWTYRLVLQGQPQLNPPVVTVVIALPVGARLRGVAGPDPSINRAGVRFRSVLDRDQSAVVSYCLCPKEA